MQLIYLQILRFIAATSVVVFHSLGQTEKVFPTGELQIFGLFHHGDYGVDIFFVISGFIIFYSTYRSNPHWSHFLRRRVERIAPLYWVLTLGLFSLALTAPQVFKNTGGYTIPYLLQSLGYVSFMSGKMPVIYVGWSLEYEMFFYLAVTFALLAMKDHAWELVAGLLCLGICVGLIFGVAPNNSTLYFLTNPQIFEFVLGMFAAMLFYTGGAPKLTIAAVGLTFGVLLIRDPANRAVIAGAPATVAVLAAAYLSRALPNAPGFTSLPAKLGDASYSIYLVQIFTISALVNFLPNSFRACRLTCLS